MAEREEERREQAESRGGEEQGAEETRARREPIEAGEPLVLGARPRLRRISRAAVAVAAVFAMLLMMLLTARYSRQSLSAAREERPPLSGPQPVGVDRIERFEAPGGPEGAVVAPPAPLVLPPLPAPRERSSELRAALRSPLVAGGGGRAARPGGASGGSESVGSPLPGFDEFERRLRGARGPALAIDGGVGVPAPVGPPGAPTRNLLPAPNLSDAGSVVRRPPPAGPYLAAGTFVPALVSHRLVSDQPGLIRAVVSRDVYDSATASRVLIPRGTVLIGRQGDLPSLGQSRLAVVWSRLVFPDGGSADLGGAPWPSASLDGSLGLAGRVRRHWGRRYGAAVLLSLVGAGLQLSQPERSSSVDRDSPGEVAVGQLGLELGRLSQEILRRYADLPPTISLEPGARVHAVLTG
ncbi:MAG TPA: TrbI/VirB10 family protein, partial [Thermoanaerobaculia bacterium]|nr:TrbI/VirB10 family protein [Thermoanaerobaculia bacterium]